LVSGQYGGSTLPGLKLMMKIDLHIHTRTGSDGKMSLADVLAEACHRNLALLAITDHDAAAHQREAAAVAHRLSIRYITGVELNVAFSCQGKTGSLDFLGYAFDPDNAALLRKLQVMAEHRLHRAQEIMTNLNRALAQEKLPPLSPQDMQDIARSADGVLGRPHIARYLVDKGLVSSVPEAFDRYLVHCDVPKYPLSLEEAAHLVHSAGGLLVLAHPNDPNGISLTKIAPHLREQTQIVEKYMLHYIDGVECWHSRADKETVDCYTDFARAHNMRLTGGSDCHQNPIIMGTVMVPEWVARQFEAAQIM
jgi:predicted metal-dependent phosphoesterase TrpH